VNFSEFDRKTVLITGASSGIGYSQAEAFLKQGAAVFAIDRNETGLHELKQAYPTTFTYWCANISDKEEVREAVHRALREHVRIDILINTAGLFDHNTPSLETTEEMWDDIFNTNIKGLYYVTNNLLPHMLKWEDGVIINTTSIAGLVAGVGGAAYTASKHAIVGYTKQLAYDYSAKGIRVNAIAPGVIDTAMHEDDEAEDDLDTIAEEVPIGRWAEPEEVAHLTLFLASSAASYLQGAVIPVDGGWTVK
jgi:3-oxoacyl-[acyl-carrier protein] reductase